MPGVNIIGECNGDPGGCDPDTGTYPCDHVLDDTRLTSITINGSASGTDGTYNYSASSSLFVTRTATDAVTYPANFWARRCGCCDRLGVDIIIGNDTTYPPPGGPGVTILDTLVGTKTLIASPFTVIDLDFLVQIYLEWDYCRAGTDKLRLLMEMAFPANNPADIGVPFSVVYDQYWNSIEDIVAGGSVPLSGTVSGVTISGSVLFA